MIENDQPIRIAVVDDEVPLMTALCHTLQDSGFEPSGFNSPLVALEALRKKEFDILLTDLMMPEMDGISLVEQALAADPDLACVIMTGQGTVGTAVEAMKAGAIDYILKPFKVSVALPVLRRALEVRLLRRENLALQEQLRENVKQLEIRNEELSLFSAAVSHDLRAPLNRIGGFAYILEETCGDRLNDEGREALAFMHSSVNEMKKLIAGLLDLAMVREAELKVRSIDLTTLATRTANALQSGPARVKVTVEPDLTVIADESLLSIVLMNLIGNAIKYSSKTEKAEITIGQDHSDQRLPFFVRDNGAGFDPARASNLFVPFKRLHSAREFTGSGIGLSTVHRIIGRHGGEIWAESVLGEGATFYFTIGSGE